MPHHRPNGDIGPENGAFTNHHLLDPLLDSWDRTLIANLLRTVPAEAMNLKPNEGSLSIAQLFTHIHYVRLIFVFEDAPEFVTDKPTWTVEHDRDRLEQLLNHGAATVRDAVRDRIKTGREMIRHYDHPLLCSST